jgi:hypothetical protein
MSKDIIEEARKLYQESEDEYVENYTNAIDDIRFARLGEQWDEATLQRRRREGRPALVINRLQAFIRQVVNDARQSKPAISVHPVDSGGDPETAQIIEDLIRHIENNSQSSVAYDTGMEQAVSGGIGYWRIGIDYAREDSWDMDIGIERIPNQFAVLPDHTSMAPDSANWNYCFVVDGMSKAEFEKRWPDAAASSWDVRWQNSDVGDDEVYVAEFWRREEAKTKLLRLSDGTILDEDRFLAGQELFVAAGLSVVGVRDTVSHKVVQHILSGSEVLDTTRWKGRYIPIVPIYGDEVIVEGKRYFKSLIRDAKDSQRMLNFWRSTTTEIAGLMSRVPYVGPRGAFASDADKWATANSISHATLEYDGPIRPSREPQIGPPVAAIQEALTSSDDIKAIVGMYDASLGARSNETSGRAIMARQREGDISTFHFLDNLARAINHTGKILLDIIPAVYNSPRVLRVRGYDGNTRAVQVNSPTEVSGAVRVYDLTARKYDLTTSMGPSYTSKRQEAADQMMEMIRVFPQSAQLIGDLLAKSQDWPEADEIAKRLKVMLPAPVRALESAQNVPPEARAAVASAQMQAMQLKQALEQGKQSYMQMQAKVASMEADASLEKAELALKKEDLDRKYALEAKKLELEMIKAGVIPQPQALPVRQTGVPPGPLG